MVTTTVDNYLLLSPHAAVGLTVGVVMYACLYTIPDTLAAYTYEQDCSVYVTDDYCNNLLVLPGLNGVAFCGGDGNTYGK